MSYLGPDMYIYIGNAEEIPAERFGFLLPGRRSWAQQHCRFVKPIVNFNPDTFTEKKTLRKQLGLPEDHYMFLAVVGSEGGYIYRMAQIEKTFELLRQDFPDAYFILVGPVTGVKKWIQYRCFLDKLYEYFAASDCVFIQSGYGKVVELSALGVPFIAIPLDYHFEQEYVMAYRLKHYGVGKLITLRHHSPQEIAREAKESVKKKVQRIPADVGTEVGRIIIETVQKGVYEH